MYLLLTSLKNWGSQHDLIAIFLGKGHFELSNKEYQTATTQRTLWVNCQIADS